MTTQRPLLVQQQFTVKAYDIDVMGIVSNIVYVRWFEDLRHLFLDQFCPYQEVMAAQISPILMRTEINYLAPLTIFDSPLASAWMPVSGRSKWEMAFEFVVGEKVHCMGRQVGCFYDLKRKRPAPIPERLRLQFVAETT